MKQYAPVTKVIRVKVLSSSDPHQFVLLNQRGKLYTQVDQGLGLGTHAPMFNRHQLSMTRYMPIPKHPLPKGQLPTVIVLHSRYSGCVGDVPSYRTFTNGGPYALRGHNTGELPGNSRFIEVLAFELVETFVSF